MKNYFFVSLLMAVSITLCADDRVIRLVADEFCPHNCEEQSSHQGYLVDLAREVFKPYGLKVEYVVEKSWKDAIELTRAGEYNAIVGTSKADAPDFIFPNIPLGEFSNCYITRVSNGWKYQGIISLMDQRLGVIVDYTYGKELNKYINKHKHDSRRIQFVSGNNAIKYSLTKVKQGKLDIYVDDCQVLAYNLTKRLDKDAFKIAGKDTRADDLYIAFGPKDPKSKKYAKILEDGIKKLKQSGRYTQIVNRYGIEENW